MRKMRISGITFSERRVVMIRCVDHDQRAFKDDPPILTEDTSLIGR